MYVPRPDGLLTACAGTRCIPRKQDAGIRNCLQTKKKDALPEAEEYSPANMPDQKSKRDLLSENPGTGD